MKRLVALICKNTTLSEYIVNSIALTSDDSLKCLLDIENISSTALSKGIPKEALINLLHEPYKDETLLGYAQSKKIIWQFELEDAINRFKKEINNASD